MTALLTLEPRLAGSQVVEPFVDFNEGMYAEEGRTRCFGCCIHCTELELATQSQ